MENAKKKNCLNCKHGYWDSDWDELSATENGYFVCEKRADDDSCKRENQLADINYLKRGKRCCELNLS